MSRIELDNEPEAVRDFFLRLPVDGEGTILSLRGKPVARVTPEARPTASAPVDGEWTDQMSRRRHDLIDKQIANTLTPAESAELAELQQGFDQFLDRVAPLPIEHARRLLKLVGTTG
jgi:antitoxin (DNA-binding transcriptional repressor) of toxin-antitoxin stability system